MLDISDFEDLGLSGARSDPMAVHTVGKRVRQLGSIPGLGMTRFGVISSISRGRQFHFREVSQLVKSNGRRLFIVDTLALVIPVSLTNCFLWRLFFFHPMNLWHTNHRTNGNRCFIDKGLSFLNVWEQFICRVP